MKITIRDLQKRIVIHPQKIKRIIRKVLREEGVDYPGELTILFVNDSKIKELNRIYHKRNTPTDVLAFDISEKNNSFLADIIVSTDTASRNAKIYGTKVETEATLYCVHGTLHLIGYRDSRKKDKIIMRKRENKYAHS